MSYPIQGDDPNNATYDDLYEAISGDNLLMDTFDHNGYQTVMIEAGWAGSSCGSRYDACLPSPWLDDLTFLSLWDGVVSGAVVSQWGHAYTVGSLNSMAALRETASALETSESPTFVFAHVVAPHPPLFLDSGCEITVSADRLGDSTLAPGVDPAIREQFLQEQMRCVDAFMEEFADLVGPEDVIVYVADHGTDRRKHLLDAGTRDPQAIIERMNVFLAARVGPGCELGDSVITSNLMRQILSCYSDTPLELLEPRVFLPGGDELSAADVSDLMSLGG